MGLNNFYNFKNPIRHFLNIDSLIFPTNISCFPIEELSWTEPVNFRVKKQDDNYRTLKMPNILNFACAYEQFKNLPNFLNVKDIDPDHKRLAANVDTGDFVSGEFSKQLVLDFKRLCIFDLLLKLDIKNYYGRIYTHKLNLKGQGLEERFLSNMNLGATNGLLMGNYLSLYFAEAYLKDISAEINQKLIDEKIECEFTYFSDDFYFYCNKNDKEKVIKIFDKILERFDLERNDNKKEIWTYENYNNYNIVEKYWKKIMADCNIRFRKDKNDNNMYFINQLIYRMANLSDNKLKKVFINNFFKTNYFQTIDLEKYKIRDYNYHQLSFIFKFLPETLLYAINTFNLMDNFDNKELEKFLRIRFRESLNYSFNDEQLYYYYAIKVLNLEHLLPDVKNLVINSDNQILISYYLKDDIFDQGDINNLLTYEDEKYWFQNYHLILYTNLFNDLENSINKYLIPANATKVKVKNTYLNFYKNNISARQSLISDINQIKSNIESYIELKNKEITFEKDDSAI